MNEAIGLRDASFAADIRVVPASRGLAWLRRGWEYFRFCPAPWIATVFVFLIATVGLTFVPIVGTLNAILVPVLLGGIMMGCRIVARGVRLRLEHVLEAFREHTGNLLLLGLINLVVSVALSAVIVVCVIAIFGMTVLAAAASQTFAWPAAFGLLSLALFAITLGVPLTMAMWFAPALIAFHDVPPLDAVRLSFIACARNVGAFLVYGLVLIPLMLLSLLTLGLGLLVPVGWGSMYASYVDVFDHK